MEKAMEIAEIVESNDTQAYRVKVTVRNNLLLTVIEEAGYKSVASFARDADIHQSVVQQFVALRKSPMNTDGTFCPAAKQIMEVLGAAPHDLWTTEQLTMSLHRNSIENVVATKFLLDATSMQSVLGSNVLKLEGVIYEDIETPEQNQTKKELVAKVKEALQYLTPREINVLSMRFGLNSQREHTLNEVAKHFRVTVERIRQIEAKALRKMRGPSYVEKVKDFIEED